MPECIYYRGQVGGTPVLLTVSDRPAADATGLCRSLAFAQFQPAADATPLPGAFQLSIASAASSGTLPAAPVARQLSPEIGFTLDPDRRQAGFQIAPNAPTDLWLERVRSEILHLLGLFTPALALHASSVLAPDGRSAWVFCGPSGAGKTTISTRLLTAFPLVDQEIVLLDLHRSPPVILNVPPTSPVGEPLAIAGLFQLKQAPACATASLAPSEFIAKNMTRPFSLNLPVLLNDRLEKLARLTDSVRPQELRFNLRAEEIRTALQA